MTTVKLDLYPAPTDLGGQKTNTDIVLANWAIEHLRQLVASQPMDEQGAVLISGWKGVRVYNAEHKLSELEVLRRERDNALARWNSLFRPDGTPLENVREVLAQMGKPNKAAAEPDGSGGPKEPL